MAPPRPSADRKASTPPRGKVPKAPAKPAPALPEVLSSATATDVEAVVAPPIARAARTSPTSGGEDADTAVNLPGTFRASLAEITSRAAPKKPAAPPSKPATLPPSSRPATSSAPPPLPAAATSSRPASSRPAPPKAPPSAARPSLAPSPITMLNGMPPAPITSRPTVVPSVPNGPGSVRPALGSVAQLPPPPVHAFGPIPNATPTAPPAPVPAIFQPVLQVVPAPAPTLKGFGPGGAPLEASSSSPMTAAVAAPDSAPPSSEDLARPSTPKAFAPVSSGQIAAAMPVPQTMPAHVAYERAFRTWSMPGPTEHDAQDESGPLSYQVYTPGNLSTPRPVSLSRLAEEAALVQPKPSLAARFAVVALGLLTVIGTASVISFAMNDESPARSAKSAIDAAKRSATPPAPTSALVMPTAITTTTAVDITPLAAPIVVVSATKPPPAAPARPAAPVAAAAGAKKTAPAAAPRASALAPDPWAPGGAASPPAPPPNPYGGTPSSVLRPPPGFKR